MNKKFRQVADRLLHQIRRPEMSQTQIFHTLFQFLIIQRHCNILFDLEQLVTHRLRVRIFLLKQKP